MNQAVGVNASGLTGPDLIFLSKNPPEALWQHTALARHQGKVQNEFQHIQYIAIQTCGKSHLRSGSCAVVIDSRLGRNARLNFDRVLNGQLKWAA
jgi:hypothetical protein